MVSASTGDRRPRFHFFFRLSLPQHAPRDLACPAFFFFYTDTRIPTIAGSGALSTAELSEIRSQIDSRRPGPECKLDCIPCKFTQESKSEHC
jgi:hypothetical protein